MQIVSNDKTLRFKTVQDIKDFKSQSLATPAKNGEQSVSMMPVIMKAFGLMVDDILRISTEKDSFR